MAGYNIKYNGEEHIYRSMIFIPIIKVEIEGSEDAGSENATMCIFIKNKTCKSRMKRFIRAFTRASKSDNLDEFCKMRGCNFIVKTDSEILATSFPIKTSEELEIAFV